MQVRSSVVGVLARPWWLPPVLLVSVAVHQLWLARSADLNAWSGGGFGMFATTDAWGRRHLHATAIHPGLRRELDVPVHLRETARAAMALPTESRLRALARALAPYADPADGPLEAVSVQVFRKRYEPLTLTPSGEPIAAVREAIER